ncbi:ribonuclease inhibitor [Erwinia typographi]|uniref:Ribonuclease inhibitor n=1 Tax=Erwinia typographi TaxID=371042 RepID=A0A0A3YQA1_9GAMM|nr:barstar family protein [Erwinia typographi]KGT88815.1 ribonuclease inhibitor [Erwinia typographi]
MNSVSFDFAKIADVDDFYRQFAHKFVLGEQFGANLDALWDALTGLVELPLRITFRHLAQHADAAQFEQVIAVMQEAEQELAGKFSLRIRQAPFSAD